MFDFLTNHALEILVLVKIYESSPVIVLLYDIDMGIDVLWNDPVGNSITLTN
jgi:hypothetical protein